MKRYVSSRLRLGIALLVSSLVSIGLFFAGWVTSNGAGFPYLIWNLLLAWVPLSLALLLERVLRTQLWSSWIALLITILWLAFLPGSFYGITSVLQLGDAARANALFDAVMFVSFICNGLILGYLSLYLVQQELAKRMRKRGSAFYIGLVLLFVSFALCIGRDLQWNAWGAVFNPLSVVFDVSDRLLNPQTYPQLFLMTASFFVLLASIYGVMWAVVRAGRTVKS